MAREILYANGALYTVEPEEIADIKVLKTIVGGKPVWEEPAARNRVWGLDGSGGI